MKMTTSGRVWPATPPPEASTDYFQDSIEYGAGATLEQPPLGNHPLADRIPGRHVAQVRFRAARGRPRRRRQYRGAGTEISRDRDRFTAWIDAHIRSTDDFAEYRRSLGEFAA